MVKAAGGVQADSEPATTAQVMSAALRDEVALVEAGVVPPSPDPRPRSHAPRSSRGPGGEVQLVGAALLLTALAVVRRLDII